MYLFKPPHEGEITGSKEDDKIFKSDLAAWTRIEKLVKTWITATFDALQTKLVFWLQRGVIKHIRN
jgi:hypothetical protein